MKNEEKLPILELEEEIIYALDNMTTRENQITFLIHTAKIYHLKLERDRLAEEGRLNNGSRNTL